MVAQQIKLLIVEDESTLAHLLKRQFEEAGYQIQVAPSGKEALRLAADEQPALIILDLQLPDLNGLEVCRELRKLYHPWVVPVLMLTGLSQPIDQLRGFAHGADAYLMKPYEWPALLSTVEQLLGQSAHA